jgi:hypothetical protein
MTLDTRHPLPGWSVLNGNTFLHLKFQSSGLVPSAKIDPETGFDIDGVWIDMNKSLGVRNTHFPLRYFHDNACFCSDSSASNAQYPCDGHCTEPPLYGLFELEPFRCSSVGVRLFRATRRPINWRQQFSAKRALLGHASEEPLIRQCFIDNAWLSFLTDS